MSASSRSTCAILNEYLARSSLHGISFVSQSNNTFRRLFWLLITFGSAAFCAYHISLSIGNFLHTPITTSVYSGNDVAIFPDITFCNLKPVSDSLFYKFTNTIFEVFQKEWKFFDQWEVSNRRRWSNDTSLTYNLRIKRIFQSFLEVLWASADTRDIGMMDDIAVRVCEYNGKQCNASDFKLVQVYKFWNCYTFKPPEHQIYNSGPKSGLKVVLYTDSFGHSKHSEDTIQFLYNRSAKEEMNYSYRLRDYLSKYSLNNVVKGIDFTADGMRVIIHPPANFPGVSNIIYDIPNGVKSTIEFTQTNYKTINLPKSNPCNPHEPPKIKFAIWFSENFTFFRTYNVTNLEKVVEEKQEHIFKKCNCYSHRYPFSSNTSSLCYHLSRKHWKNPPKEEIAKWKCHDRHYYSAERSSYQYYADAQGYRPCEFTQYKTSRSDSVWPSNDDIIEFINFYIIPAFVGKKNGQKSHNVYFLKELSQFKNRADAILKTMLHQDCNPSVKNTSFHHFWCTDFDRVRMNLLYVWVKPKVAAADQYIEAVGYQWPEVLSEIGGTIGLWMGTSLLASFEFLELIILVIRGKYFSFKKHEEEVIGTNNGEVQCVEILSSDTEPCQNKSAEIVNENVSSV